MSATSRAARRRPRRSPRRVLLLASIAAIALGAVVALAVAQSRGGGGGTLPPRTAAASGRTLGSATAPVTIVEYADFQCPVCKRAETTIIPQLEKDYIQAGKVKLEFRDYPFLGQESFDAAQAAAAAADQGKFWQYHDALFNAQGAENSGAFTYANLVKLAQQVGLDVPLFERTFTANAHLAAIQQERDAAAAAGVNSTPTFFVGGQKIVGLQPYAAFQAAVDAALRAAAR